METANRQRHQHGLSRMRRFPQARPTNVSRPTNPPWISSGSKPAHLACKQLCSRNRSPGSASRRPWLPHLPGPDATIRSSCTPGWKQLSLYRRTRAARDKRREIPRPWPSQMPAPQVRSRTLKQTLDSLTRPGAKAVGAAGPLSPGFGCSQHHKYRLSPGRSDRWQISIGRKRHKCIAGSAPASVQAAPRR